MHACLPANGVPSSVQARGAGGWVAAGKRRWSRDNSQAPAAAAASLSPERHRPTRQARVHHVGAKRECAELLVVCSQWCSALTR